MPVMHSDGNVRIAYFVSHPIQYQVPLLSRLAVESDIVMKTFFASNLSVRTAGYHDAGFGQQVKWDMPLLAGYDYEFLPAWRDGDRLGFASPINHKLFASLRSFRPHLIWLHGYNTINQLRLIAYARMLKIPLLLRIDGTLFDRPRSAMKLAAKQLFFRAIEPAVSGALAVGSANADYWNHYFGGRVPVFDCPYAVDNEFFHSRCQEAALQREQFRASLGLEPGRPVILFAAKFLQRKRAPDLLRAFFKIVDSPRLAKRPHLLVIGDGEERPLVEALAAQAQPGDVQLLGFRNQTELPAFYDLCDCFVLASVDEPWGLAINEVMNAARPVIVTDQVGCQKDLVMDGVNGAVCKPRDPDSLAEALLRVLEDEDKLRAMGEASLRIVSGFNFEQNVSAIRGAIEDLVPGFKA